VSSFRLEPAVAADAAAVTEIVVELESSLYGQSGSRKLIWRPRGQTSTLSRTRAWSATATASLATGRARRGRVVPRRGCVHPDARGIGIGKLIAIGLENDAARRGAHRIQNAVIEADAAAGRLLESLGYRAVRVFRELRIELYARPRAAQWPNGLAVVPFDPR